MELHRMARFRFVRNEACRTLIILSGIPKVPQDASELDIVNGPKDDTCDYSKPGTSAAGKAA